MKSAYELAMERLNRNAPSKPLSADQKAAIAEIETVYRAKIAEQEIRFREQIQTADASGDYEKSKELRDLLSTEKQRLQEQGESKKEEIRRRSK